MTQPSEPAPSEPSSPAKAQWLVAFGLGTLLVAHALYTTAGVLMDDAYIAIRYAQRLASGQGLTFQAGPPVEGYTCFSWVVLGALFEKLGLPSTALLPLVGIGCGAATVLVATRAAQRFAGDKSPLAGALPGLVLACSPSLAYYSGNGLETAAFVLLVLLTIVFTLEGRARATGITAALALLTRPEGAVVAAGALALGLLRAAPAARRRWLATGAGVAGVALAYAAFKWSYFGSLTPNTAVAKPPDLTSGLRYLVSGGGDAAPLLLLAVVAAYRERRRCPALWLGVAWTLLLAAIAVLEGGDWMPGGRLLLPALAALALSLEAVRLALRQGTSALRYVLGSLAALAAVFYLRGSVSNARGMAQLSEQVASYEPLRDDIAMRLVQQGVRSVGTLDIGRISYAAPELRIFDLGGLTDREVARLPGDYRGKHLPAELLQARAPDAFLFTAGGIQGGKQPQLVFYYAVERDVATSAWFQERYRLLSVLPIRPDYALCWYARIPGS